MAYKPTTQIPVLLTPLVDKRIGDAFPKVEKVYEELDTIHEVLEELPQFAGAVDVHTTVGFLTDEVNEIRQRLVLTPHAIALVIDGSTGVQVRDLPTEQFLEPLSQNKAVSLGSVGQLFEKVWARTALISDRTVTARTNAQARSTAENQIVTSLKSQVQKFQLPRESNAKFHFGISAQAVQTAFFAKGLDPRDYAMFEYDSDNNLCGINETELLWFLLG